MKRTFKVNTWVRDGEDAVVTFDYYPGRAGRYSGPPETCYEDEPDEIEIVSVIVNGKPEKLNEADEEELNNRLFDEGRAYYYEEGA